MKWFHLTKFTLLLLMLSDLRVSGFALAEVPRSCEESLAFGNNYTGLHKLQSLDGAKYTAFCQFDVTTRTGFTFLSKYAVEYNKLDIDLMFTDRNHVIIRILNSDGTQSDTRITQIPQYADIPLSIQQSTATNYTYPTYTSNFGQHFLFLGFLPKVQAGVRHSQQGWTSNQHLLNYSNCDGHPNNYMIFYPDIAVGPNPGPTHYSIVNEYLNTRTATDREHYLAPVGEFNYTGEIHFGGCGVKSCTRYWNIKGWSLGIPFKSISCYAQPCVLFATYSYQPPYYPGDAVRYSCIKGYAAKTPVRCGIQGEWLDQQHSCIRIRPDKRNDKYTKIDNPSSWRCTWAISDVIPHMTRLRCAKLCTEQSHCMIFAVDGANCILTNGIMGNTDAFKEYAHWYIKR